MKAGYPGIVIASTIFDEGIDALTVGRINTCWGG